MGCVESKIDKEERVRNCKERKRLMKHLLGFRREFAEAQLAYLRALKNTGVTLRQFTESETLELEDTNFRGSASVQEDVIEIDDDDSHTPPPPPVTTSDWEYWNLFSSPYPQCGERRETIEQGEEENWEETNTEFIEEDEDKDVVDDGVVDMDPEKQQTVELVDDNSSMASWYDKGTSDMAIVVSRSSKTLAGIFRDLDDYFLKASAGVKDVAVLIDIHMGDGFLYQSIKEQKRKRHNSAKASRAFTWGWSSKSINSTRDAGDFLGPSEPCKPGSHCVTLEKIYTEEQKLYKEVKEEESTKAELEKKSLLLQKQEEEIHDLAKTEKLRLRVESLQSDISLLQQSISKSCSTIVKLIDAELHPQLVAITSGLRHMWQTMCECHKVQNHLSQRLNHLTSQQSIDCTSEYRRQAAIQLKTEVTSWYNSLCRVITSQHEYVKTLCSWIQLTNCLRDGDQPSRFSSVMASEAIKNFLSVIHSIVSQQEEELRLQKRAAKLERKLQRELNSLAELEMKFEGSFTAGDANSDLSSKHPLSIKRAKLEALKKRADDEKAKYTNSVHTTQVMFLNNLQTSLPNLFQALVELSSSYSQTF
nr:nitrate regulatory gene2 protein [Ipomoea batatas]